MFWIVRTCRWELRKGVKYEQSADAGAAFRPVLLYAAQPPARRAHGASVPAEQNCGGTLLQPGPGSCFRWDLLRPGRERLDRAHDPQYRRAVGKGRSAA